MKLCFRPLESDVSHSVRLFCWRSKIHSDGLNCTYHCFDLDWGLHLGALLYRPMEPCNGEYFTGCKS